MFFYYSIFTGLVLVSLVAQDKKLYYWLGAPLLGIILLSMFFVLAFRHGVGNDYYSYQRIFYGVSDIDRLGFFVYKLSETTPIESGFATLILITRYFADSYAVFVFLWAALSVGLKYIVFTKVSPFVALSFLIYFSDEWFWKDLSGARVALASTFILLGFYYAKHRMLASYTVSMLLAILFHSASVIALPVYILRGFFLTRSVMSIVLVFSIFLAGLGGVGIIITELAMTLGAEESSRLLKYADSKYADGIRPFGGTFSIHILLSALMICCYRKLSSRWDYNKILVPVYVYGSALMFALIDYGILAGRIREMICIPALVVVLPSFILLFKGNERLIAYSAIIVYCALWFYMMTVNRAPYQSIFQINLYGF